MPVSSMIRRSVAHASRRTQAPMRDDQPGLLGQRDERRRAARGRARGAPSARAPRSPRCAPSASDDQRLVVQAQLAALDAAAQRGLQRERGRGRRWRIASSKTSTRLAAVLGAVHRGVGVADQVLGRLEAVARERDADARLQERLAVLRRGTARRTVVEQALGDRRARPRRRRCPRTAASTRRRRSARACRTGAGRELRRMATSTSRRSPASWPSESLTTLKRSRSRNSTATPRVAPARAPQRLAEAVEEQRAVGQAGERVVQRAVGELELGALALGDVARHADHLVRLAAGRRGRRGRSSPATRSSRRGARAR